MKSALSVQEKDLSNKDQVYINSLAKARWTRAIQKTLPGAMGNRAGFYSTFRPPSGFGF
ncbi:protein unc-13A-like [Platysternon megacephalum]|uniref:Protein unc-13A-like n=1 Tax=Platysternon megacephalum TaxID=55544 RepID=A0A4D9E337_9SAUR|nr:protein unc-13A-like [Platysternon megacephalum]